MIAWALISIAHALGTHWHHLHFCACLAAAFRKSCGMKAVSLWFPAKECLCRPASTISAPQWLNACAAARGLALLADTAGAFIITGVLALIWVAVWLRYYFDPRCIPS